MPNWINTFRQLLGQNARQERRGEFRADLKIPIEIRAASGTTYRGVSRDISPLGMGAVVYAYLELGEQIWIKYEHPTEGEQTTRAVVRHAKVKQRHGYRYGFEFQLPVEPSTPETSPA